MGSRRRNLFILLLVVGLVAASAFAINQNQTRLGLDLRGGVELVYQGQPTPAQPEVTPEAIDRSLEIIRERTDKLGVAEPEIQRVGADQILVGLPDVRNAQRAIDQVGTTAQLYFYDWEPNAIGDPERPVSRLYDAVKRASEREPECRECTVDDRYYLFNERTKRLVEGPRPSRRELFADLDNPEQAREEGEVLRVPRGTLVVESERAAPTDQEREAPPSYFVIRDRPELSGTDIKNPEQAFDPTTNQPNVTFEFTGEGRRKFHAVTRRIAERGLENHLPGNPVLQDVQHFAIVLDDRLVSRPYIDFQQNPDGIDGRTGAQISGGFTIPEAQDLANFLRIGALPINLELISQTQVSATLGKQALDQGLKAGIAGLILVLIFLVGLYRLLGIIASLALLTYAVLFYGLIVLIPVTLTLPGIAGLILTIGIAADSNIVIFERIKEEVRSGKSMPASIAAGYSKGFKTILDANVVTLLTAFILFVLATAGVKGFAFTLGVGTLVSLFTAVVFTQAILGSFSRAKFLRRPSVLGARPDEKARWRLNFTGMSKWFFSISGLILLAGALSFSTLGINLGIDFESGTRLKASLERDVSESDVRQSLTRVDLADAEIQGVEDPEFGDTVFNVRTTQLEPNEVGRVERVLREDFGLVRDGFQSESIGPTFGKQVAQSAVYALIFSLLLISGYIALRFQPKFAVPVLIAVVHDLLITAGVYSLTDREVSSATVAALLTILGYSLYDTIIVFDRIRENMPRMPGATFSQVVNRSVSEVLTRSLATTLSTALPVAMLLFFGGETLKDFAFALLVGLVSGTYSSLFIASPVLTHWKERESIYRRRRARLNEEMGYVPPFAEDNVVARLGELDEADEAYVDAEEATQPATHSPVTAAGRYPGDGGASGSAGAANAPEPAEAPEPDPVGGTPEPPKKSKSRSKRRSERKRKHGRNR